MTVVLTDLWENERRVSSPVKSLRRHTRDMGAFSPERTCGVRLLLLQQFLLVVPLLIEIQLLLNLFFTQTLRPLVVGIVHDL